MGWFMHSFTIGVLAGFFYALLLMSGAPLGYENCSDPLDPECPDRFFSVSYYEARTKFRRAAMSAGADETTWKVVHTDPDTEEEFTIDIATFHGTSKQKLLVHVSGTHGVEGYAGSAIQLKLLEDIKKSGGWKKSPTLVFIHAMNPYGMEKFRRFNHNNVDLNRNALTAAQWKEVLARDPNIVGYENFRSVFQPTEPLTLWTLVKNYMRLPQLLFQHGNAALKTALVTGQYHDRKGLFYGGGKLERNYEEIYEYLRQFSDEVEVAAAVDVHTGLGPSGVDTLMTDDQDSFDALKKMAADLGEKKVDCAKCGGDLSEAGAGYGLAMGNFNIRPALKNLHHYVDLTEEFGTVHPWLVAGSVIAENAAFWNMKHTLSHEWTKRWIRSAFYVQSVQWKTDVLANGVAFFNGCSKYISEFPVEEPKCTGGV